MKAGAREFSGPNTEIRVVAGGQTAAFFDIEKDDGAGTEAFGLRGSCGILRVLGSDFFCRGFILELAAFPAGVQNQEAETLGAKKFSLALPRICFLSGWRAEPVARERKRLPQNRHCCVTGINVAVEAKVGAWSGLGSHGSLRRHNASKQGCR